MVSSMGNFKSSDPMVPLKKISTLMDLKMVIVLIKKQMEPYRKAKLKLGNLTGMLFSSIQKIMLFIKLTLKMANRKPKIQCSQKIC